MFYEKRNAFNMLDLKDTHSGPQATITHTKLIHMTHLKGMFSCLKCLKGTTHLEREREHSPSNRGVLCWEYRMCSLLIVYTFSKSTLHNHTSP